LGNKAIPR